MNPETITQKQTRCPVCGAGQLQRQLRTEQFDYDADEERVTVVADKVPVEICDACGETFSGPEAARVRGEAVCRTLGILTSKDVRSIRDRLGLTQEQFARLTRISEGTISRWERGLLIPDRAMDRYLRLLAADANNVRLLEQLNAPGAPPLPSQVPSET